MRFDYYLEMLRGFKRIRPDVHLKCFTAVEIAFFADLYTRTDEQVLRELVTGSQPEDVADLLGITVGTLRNHIKKIYKKLHVRNRIELMRRAESLGYR